MTILYLLKKDILHLYYVKIDESYLQDQMHRSYLMFLLVKSYDQLFLLSNALFITLLKKHVILEKILSTEHFYSLTFDLVYIMQECFDMDNFLIFLKDVLQIILQQILSYHLFLGL